MSSPVDAALRAEAEAPAAPLNFELLRSEPGDRYFDYCLQPYQPRRSPRGKLRGENLLWQTLDEAGLLEQARPPLLALQRSLGRDMVVWGAKHNGIRMFWEFYIYDPRKEDPKATVAGLRETLAPWLDLRPAVRESIPYMMVSFDLDAGILERGQIDELNLYLTGSELHEGRSYKVYADSPAEFENYYRFLEPKREIDTVLPLLTSSMWVDYDADPTLLAKVLIPTYFACRRVCVAKKRLRDGIYFSGIDIDQLAEFLRRFDYPLALRRFVREHGDAFDHLYFDVGIDYQPDGQGGIDYPKTGFYGTL